ncbi:uncharacterized protein LOC133263401 isoform X1 [Pezoporus flaviventris]|uniref:uncharacterized protein LOC133263401 isoform X1 n=1 Tax=Pezoporus flaviventris TaxID=889875 RepID=UPI002AB0EE4E|nr:uncharacterized protein LOC133263401 isoform X1 [Pezoporus flaviventris]
MRSQHHPHPCSRFQMSSVLRSIHECLRNSSREDTWRRMDMLLILMAIKHPRALMVSMVLNVPLRDRADMNMWEMVLTISETSEALRELLGVLQDTRDTSIPNFVPMASGAGGSEGAEDPQSLMTASVLLESLFQLSEKPGLGCSRLRELSIRLLQLLLELVFGWDRRRMRSKTWDLLLPLFFHMSDQSRSVAEVRTCPIPPYPTFPRVGSSPRCRLPSHPVQASRGALLAAATLLEWEELRRLLKTRQMWRVAECLLERSRKRAQGYLDQSLRYLQDAQVPLQEAAVRFIGLAARPLRGKSPWKLQQICRGEEGAVAGGMLLATEGLIPLSLDHSSGSAAG